MYEITISLETLLFICSSIAVIGGALVWVKKGISPFTEPLKRLDELEDHRTGCDSKFEEQALMNKEMSEDINMILKSILLLMKHAETGNCTGEVGKGRSTLEEYIVNRGV